MWNTRAARFSDVAIVLIALLYLSVLPVLRGGQGTPHQSPDNQDLVIRISSPKSSYEVGSSVPLRIEILNRSQRQLLIGFLLDEVAGEDPNHSRKT